MIKLKQNHGFTLIELVISMTVILIIISAIVPLFSTSIFLTSSGMTQNNLRQEGRWAIDIISKELSSIDITKVTSPTLLDVNGSHTLTFTSFNSSNRVTYTVPENTVEIYRLKRPITDGQRARVQPNDLIFTRNSDGASIDISIKLTQTDNKNVTHTETITATITPLNNGNDNLK